ncbi:MAG TPA: hypothetical protein VFV08_08960 [Puia sp.]|nr:hypothetical protein [Puia sp.]
MQFTIKNAGNQPAIIESMGTPVMDIVVDDGASRRILASWSAQNPDKVMHHLEWQPGESKVLELVWIPPQEEDSRQVFASGLLYQESKFLQGANVDFCVGLSGPPC